MKKTFTLLASTMMLFVTAQEETIYQVDFEGDLSEWVVEDLDGDGENWSIVSSSAQAEEQGWGPDGTLMAGSFSYSFDPEGPLYPDNILVSPAIELPADKQLNLEFLIGTNVDFMNDHNFALYIVNEFNGFDQSWNPVYEQNFLGIDTAQQAALDISDFAGQTVQLVFRHYNSDEQFVLLLDDIMIKAGSLGVNDFASNVKLSIYPNPVEDFINIKVDGEIENIDIYSINGQLIKNANAHKINVSDLPKGVYILKIKTTNEFFTKKIIKK
ncbi:T9SS type A sorting domain-containing protein [Flavobacteriaceae bacterium Ap0902]|nr:T9SS type A sorting domain-containing protein [Flavobacteriaceae bacterium Ap0902]